MTNTNKLWKDTFISWLPLAATIVIFAGLVYVAVLQNYRSVSDDPQIQIAEDISMAVSAGKATPDQIVSAAPSQDMTSTLATFVAMYNATGTPLGASVVLNGKLPPLP